MKLSIVISAYNLEYFIDNCLLSCLSQDLELNKNYEIIVVNDGSKDQTLSHLKAYGEKIRVISQENAGVSVARNNGLQHAKGEYVWFIDGDDYIEENCLNSILEILERNKLDILTVDYCEVAEKEDFKVKDKPSFIISDSRVENYGNSTELVIWNSIIRRHYLLDHGLQFIRGMKYGEDTVWISLVELFTQKHLRLKYPIYKYRMRASSAVHTQNEATQLQRFKDMQTMQDTWLNAIKYLGNEMTIEKRNQIQTRIRWCTSNILLAALQQSKEVRESTLKKLKDNGSYPYKVTWERLSIKDGYKTFLTTLFTLSFPIELYYKTVSWLFGNRKI
ncbi:glycosyltransferase [Parabacteroides faecis]|uniref:glycosyltransferase n=1 Tax=Parabacteroides faecis TaxID=1217282 RepID=UPI002164AF06|nr:glycosyltransferase [Parabacteroides faecis]MCS2893476.1 glycosyltransferase [Parabacteroides faecis]UVQ47926.1 glycosyltransferase [Parabacteroides faecis]